MTTLWCRPAGAASTEIVIAADALTQLRRRARGRSVMAIVDAAVAALSPELVDPDWTALRLHAGEEQKSLRAAEDVLRAMVAAGLDRRALVIAIGGGTIGDLAGFCASLFLRGVELWQAPTTLLAMVDSAVGGKTAVNLPEGKNLVGTVHAPALVAVEPALVATLPDAEFRSGLAEAIKVAIGLDAALFELLATERARIDARDAGVVATVVRHCLQQKSTIVETDLRETGPRGLLNLGHTLGHALEAHADFKVPHGLCVARGLHFAIDLALARGDLPEPDARRCRDLLIAYGHHKEPLPPAAELLPFLRRDKKAEGDIVHFVAPVGVGASRMIRVPFAELTHFIAGR